VRLLKQTKSVDCSGNIVYLARNVWQSQWCRILTFNFPDPEQSQSLSTSNQIYFIH